MKAGFTGLFKVCVDANGVFGMVTYEAAGTGSTYVAGRVL